MALSPLRLLFLSCLSTLCGPQADSARWDAALERTVEWRWQVEQRLELQEMSLRPAGSIARSDRRTLPAHEFLLRDGLELVTRDRLLRRGPSHPELIEREWRRARRSTQVTLDQGSHTLEAASALEESRLRYSWDAQDPLREDPEAQERELRITAAPGEEVEPELLAGLEPGLDLRGLLGTGPRELGDTWELDEEVLWSLVKPGGELSLALLDSPEEPAHHRAALGWLLSTTLLDRSGEVRGKVRYAGRLREGEKRLACLRLEITIEASGEVRERLRELAEEAGIGQGWLDATEAIRVEHLCELEGVLYWDLGAMRADALELEGETEVRLDLDLDLTAYGMRDPRWELEARLRGHLALSVSSAEVSED